MDCALSTLSGGEKDCVEISSELEQDRLVLVASTGDADHSIDDASSTRSG